MKEGLNVVFESYSANQHAPVIHLSSCQPSLLLNWSLCMDQNYLMYYRRTQRG